MARSFFWDKMADRYSKLPIADEAAYQHKLKITREYFRPDMDVLEFGCGTGSTAIEHAPFVGHIHAIDISSKMLEIARGKAREKGVENLTFERTTMDEIRVPDQSYDAILGLSILHLLKNKEKVISRIYSLLRPGGVFVSSTMCVGDSMNFMKLIVPLGRPFGLVLRIFSRKELEDSIAAAGLEVGYIWQPSGKGRAVFIIATKPKQDS